MSAPSHHLRKRDKFLNLFRSSSQDPKVKSQSVSLQLSKDIKQSSTADTDTTQLHRLSTVSTNARIIGVVTESENNQSQSSVEIEHGVTTRTVKYPAPSITPSTLQAKPRLDVFNQNINPPSVQISLPEIRTRIDNTHQLALCIGLLRKNDSNLDVVDLQEDFLQSFRPDATAQSSWIETVKKDPIEQDHIRWLGVRMVDEFAKDASKDSKEISEIVLLGPVLDKDTYRRLLECATSAFANAIILDVDLLQGVVQLIQSSPPGSLLPDDLVKILRILRVRLQDTHQQSSVHPFHLTLAVSRLLDVMAEHKVKDLNRVVEHEPLSGVLSGLKDSSDPYLMYQACYAFQALQYVPDDETSLQAVLRHSTGVIDGLVKVSAVFKLDVGAVLEGLGNLQEALGGAIDTATTVYGGVCSLLESGRGVVEGLKEGLKSGQKRPWYSAIRAANAFAQGGQLKDLNQLIYEAPCRRDPLFQWGICQLLGEIASDDMWDINIHQQAITLLGDLYKNDDEWGQDESVKVWMLRIIGQLGTTEDLTIKNTAHTWLQELKNDQDTVSNLPYPLRNRLPLPTSSPILARVQNIPYVEYDLHLHKVQRLEQSTQSVYIPPLAKPSLNAKDEDLFHLMEKVQEFLQSERQVMLVLGDSGSGKSTFNRHLEHQLWNDYKQGDAIPLFINLPGIREPDDDMVTKQLRIYNFKDDQIQELKLHRHLILICDGYDESQQLVNLHKTNMLNQRGQWSTKMIISCRTQFLGPTYLDRFKPQPLDRYSSSYQDLFQEAVIAPFTKDQIKDYVEQYAKDPQSAVVYNNSQTPWSADEYMDKLAAIPNVMDLVKNPFLLTLALKALPGLVASNKDLASISVTRAGLYDRFIDQWLETNKIRLQSNTLTKEELAALNSLMDDDFITQGVDYLLRLSAAIFKEQEGNPIIQYIHRQDKNIWKAEFFGTDPEIKLLRDASPLIRTGNQYRFVHRSVLEYLLSRVIYDPTKNDEDFDPQAEAVSITSQLLDTNGPLFQSDLLKEPSVINFLCDRVKLNPGFKHRLRAVIDQSKTDASTAIAATNAITILVKSGVPFNGADLRGIKVPGADLSGGQFDSAHFQGADLRNVNLSKSWLRQADMTDTHMEDVRFGELPYFEMDNSVYSCSYSPDGKMLGAGLNYGNISIYSISTSTTLHCLKGHTQGVVSIAFSPDSQRLVSGSQDKTVRVWNTTSGEALLVMEGHSDDVYSVAISPCGYQIASAGVDKTVRLWDMQTGETLFVMEGHKSIISRTRYSPDGHQLVSVSERDETIRFWDVKTGESRGVVSTFRQVTCVAYSPDGRWVVASYRGRWVSAGFVGDHLQLWDAVTLEPGPIFSEHSSTVTAIDFSPDGRWIASSGIDTLVKLWDASTRTLVAEFTGHGDYINCVAFSPDGRHIASGGNDKKMRLWEVGPSWSSLDLRNVIEETMLRYSRDGQSILSYDLLGFYRKRDAATGTSEPIHFEIPEQEKITSRGYSPYGDQVAFSYEGGLIRLWNCLTGIAGPVLEEPSSRIIRLIFSRCCRWFVSVDERGTMRLWDLYDVELRSRLVDCPENFIHGNGMVEFSSTGSQFAILTEKTIRLFDTQSRVCLSQLDVELDFSSSWTFSPNDQQIAAGDRDGKIYLWNLRSREPNIVLQGHNGVIQGVSYSSCGQWIASTSFELIVGIWHRQSSGEVESWSRVHSICSIFGWIYDLAWNPIVPMELFIRTSNGSIQVWRLLVGEDGKVVFKMIWGVGPSLLCAEGVILTNAVGLSPIYQKMLAQRGAICPSDEPTLPHD